MTEEELNDWIQKMNKGSKEAFRMIYEQSMDQVFRTVSFLVSNKQDVSDVVNEVFTAMFQSLPNYDFQKPYRAWLNGLIVRQTRNWNRKIWRRFRLQDRKKLLEIAEHAPDTEQIHLQKEHSSELISLVQKLSYKHSVVLVLRYYQQCSFEEIAELLEIPVGTVKSRHHIGLEKLRKKAKGETKFMEEASHYVH